MNFKTISSGYITSSHTLTNWISPVKIILKLNGITGLLINSLLGWIDLDS